MSAPLSFYTVLSKVIQSSELILSYCKVNFVLFLFFLVLCCRINTRCLNTMEQWTLSVKHSGEMRDSLRHFLFC